jgi:hypothetical protein
MSDDFFDFGFTAVNEEELEAVQQASIKVEEAVSTNERLEKLFNAIQPLLTNLKMNPEKDYIYWPDRLNKVEQFETMLQRIYTGNPNT